MRVLNLYVGRKELRIDRKTGLPPISNPSISVRLVATLCKEGKLSIAGLIERGEELFRLKVIYALYSWYSRVRLKLPKRGKLVSLIVEK